MIRFSILLPFIISSVFADKVIDAKTDQRNFVTSTDIDIIKRFFNLEGLDIDVTDTNFLNRYSPDVITKMNEMMLHVPHDPLKVLELNNQVNTMILETELKHLPRDEEKPFNPSDKAVLKALDLMVPETADDSEYFLAKEDLKKFYEEQPSLAKELLDRIRMAPHLYTDELARLLRNFYYHWIPLGRLMDVISKIEV